MANHVVIPILISFALSVIMGPFVIPFLRRLKMGQTERVDGVQSHLKKAGTPTMGGGNHFVVLCKRLSKDHSGFVFDSGIRSDWIFR